MSVRIVIDSLDFVRNAGMRHGKIPLSEFKRLHSLLFDHGGELSFHVAGQYDENERPGLYLEIQGDMQLSCQRCLDKLAYRIDIQTFLLLAKTETELSQHDDNDALDAILAAPELDIISLIEDEVILDLSISVRHPDNECSMHSPAPNENNLIDQAKNEHPFAALASLKKTNRT